MSEANAEVVEISGELSLFGFVTEAASLRTLSRSRGWRGLRAVAFIGGGLLLAPVLGVFPPHVPWVLGAVGVGGVLGIRKWRERFTLVSFEGACPKCGSAMYLKAGTPVRPSLWVPCDNCHHDSRLTVAWPDDTSTSPASPHAVEGGSRPTARPGPGGTQK